MSVLVLFLKWLYRVQLEHCDNNALPPNHLLGFASGIGLNAVLMSHCFNLYCLPLACLYSIVVLIHDGYITDVF